MLFQGTSTWRETECCLELRLESEELVDVPVGLFRLRCDPELSVTLIGAFLRFILFFGTVVAQGTVLCGGWLIARDDFADLYGSATPSVRQWPCLRCSELPARPSRQRRAARRLVGGKFVGVDPERVLADIEGLRGHLPHLLLRVQRQDSFRGLEVLVYLLLVLGGHESLQVPH